MEDLNNNSSNNNNLTSSKFIQQFIHEARNSPAENERNSGTLANTPSWVQPSLLKQGQEFVQTHFFAIYFSHFISLLFLFCYQPIRSVLVRTEKSSPSYKSLKRYFSTLSHVRSWYEGNLLDENSVASLDILNIRRVHSNVAGALNRIDSLDLDKNTKGQENQNFNNKVQNSTNKNYTCPFAPDKNNNNNINYHKEASSFSSTRPETKIIHAFQQDFSREMNSTTSFSTNNEKEDESIINLPVPIISQLDMIITQFCFMGFISLYPKIFGIFTIKSTKAQDKAGLEGFLHLWALIGHRLGIEEKFNLCLEPNCIDDNNNNANDEAELDKMSKNLVVQKLFLNSILNIHSKQELTNTQILWESLVNGISSFIPCMSLPAILSFCLIYILKYKSTSNLTFIFGVYDKVCFTVMVYCFNSWLSYPIIRKILNDLLRLALFLTTIRFYFYKMLTITTTKTVD